MKVITAILLSLVAFAGVKAVRAQQTSDNERAAIEVAVETYLYEEDRAKVARVVDPGAKILSVDGKGKLAITATSKPAGKMPKGATTRVPRQKIVNIDIFENGAVVKVETGRLSLEGPERRRASRAICLATQTKW